MNWKKKTFRKKKRTGYTIPRPMGRAGRIHTLVRHAAISVLDISAGNVYYNISPVLSAFANYTQATSLFDEYCISKCQVIVVPLNPQSVAYSWTTAGATATINALIEIPVFSSAPTPTLTGTPAAESAIIDSDNSIIHGPMNKTYKRWFTPRCQMDADVTGVGTKAVAADPDTWLSTATPSVTHCGMLLGFTHGNTYAAGTLEVVIYLRGILKFRSGD